MRNFRRNTDRDSPGEHPNLSMGLLLAFVALVAVVVLSLLGHDAHALGVALAGAAAVISAGNKKA